MKAVPIEISPTDTPARFEKAIGHAVTVLQAGGVVALPTETVYGLAANAFDPQAVAKIFLIKGRPAHNPIIVHVANAQMACECVAQWTKQAEKLAQAFWPGPLTLVLTRSAKILDIVSAGGQTVGIRYPRHPVILEVIRRCGFPLAAPSANLSNRISPTNAQDVYKHLKGKIPLIVDGGASQVGIESTVLDLSSTTPRILRPGMIHEESLAAVLKIQPEVLMGIQTTSTAPLKSPGQLPKHYSPKARTILLKWENELELMQALKAEGLNSKYVWIIHHHQSINPSLFLGCSQLPRDPSYFAQALYAELHRGDEANPQALIIERTPETPPWRGLADRLKRAAA
jgi:L-threonylcarbamoyladenylate synthase